MRFDRALQGYWLEKGRDFSPRTVADYKVTFKRFRAFVDDTDVADISADVVRSFLVHLDQDLGLGGKTRSNAWTALSSFWTWAEQELGIEHVIHNRVARPSYKRAVIEAYSEADVKAMLFACDHAAGWSTKTGRSARVARPTATRDKAIIVTLLAEAPGAAGVATDLSPAALAVARHNAAVSGVDGRLELVETAWARGIDGQFDLIVSNPPYIPQHSIAGLDREVREHDPHLALAGGPDGLDAYRGLLAEAAQLVKPGGHVVVEFGAGHDEDVVRIAKAYGLALVDGGLVKDLGGHVRCAVLLRS